jgi:LacI family transcriptional regulator
MLADANANAYGYAEGDGSKVEAAGKVACRRGPAPPSNPECVMKTTGTNQQQRGGPPRQRAPMLLLALERRDEALLHGILDLTHQLGWRVIDLRFFAGQIPPRVMSDGALVDAGASNRTLFESLRAMGCPVVNVSAMAAPAELGIPQVADDQAAAGRLAAEHFIERGFRDMAYIGHRPWAEAKPLYDGFCRRIRQHDARCHLLRFTSQAVTPAVLATRQRQFEAWIETIPRPVGVLAYHDRMGGRICAMCRYAGLSVPEEVAVLARGNSRLECEFAPITLSSIDPDLQRQGEEAVRLLQRLMRGEPPPEEPVLVAPKGVVVRRSTDVLAVPDPVVARALRFMWDHLDWPLSVNDIARDVRVSRRKLERDFQRELGRTPGQELMRKRLERCCELLVDTDLSVTAIAPQIGFPSKTHLHRAFRKTFGTSPRRFRLRHRTGPAATSQ